MWSLQRGFDLSLRVGSERSTLRSTKAVAGRYRVPARMVCVRGSVFGAEQGNQCGKLAFAPARKIVMAEQRRRVGPQAQGFGQRIARLGMALHQFFERRVQRRQRIVLALAQARKRERSGSEEIVRFLAVAEAGEVLFGIGQHGQRLGVALLSQQDQAQLRFGPAQLGGTGSGVDAARTFGHGGGFVEPLAVAIQPC